MSYAAECYTKNKLGRQNKAVVPSLWDLIQMIWGAVRNNKVRKKYNVAWIIPKPLPLTVREKLSYHETSPWGQKGRGPPHREKILQSSKEEKHTACKWTGTRRALFSGDHRTVHSNAEREGHQPRILNESQSKVGLNKEIFSFLSQKIYSSWAPFLSKWRKCSTKVKE